MKEIFDTPTMYKKPWSKYGHECSSYRSTYNNGENGDGQHVRGQSQLLLVHSVRKLDPVQRNTTDSSLIGQKDKTDLQNTCITYSTDNVFVVILFV